MRLGDPTVPYRSDPTRIWPEPAIWLWLLINLLWLHVVVPFWIVSADLHVLDPAASLLRKALALGVMIVVIPFVCVIGLALGSLAVLRSFESRLRGNR